MLFFLIDTIVGFIELLIGVRILLKFFGANLATPFVAWVYETSRPLLAPFANMFPSPTFTSGFVIEFSALFALIFYAFIGVLVEEALQRLYGLALERRDRRR